MSNLGIGMVGSIAQGNLQAQQLGRALHRRQTDAAAEAKRARERLAAHFEALDEGDDAGQLAELHVDEQGAHREPPHDQLRPTHASQSSSDEAAVDENSQIAGPDGDDENGMPRHLDVTA